MKKKMALLCLMVSTALFVGCVSTVPQDVTTEDGGKDATQTAEQVFTAEVLTVEDGRIIVEALEGQEFTRDEIAIETTEPFDLLGIQEGDLLDITCSGVVLEVYPAKLADIYEISMSEMQMARGTDYQLLYPSEVLADASYKVEGNEIFFYMNDGEDMICTFSCVAQEEFEELLGRNVVAGNDDKTVYVQLPTCGTLKNATISERLEEIQEMLMKVTVVFVNEDAPDEAK